MSIKSIVLFTSLFIILNGQSNLVWADNSSPFINDDIEAAESMKAMRPLFDLDQNKIPLLDFEQKSPIKDDTLMTQEALDKQVISGLKGASFLSTKLEDEIVNDQFAKRIQFSPTETGIDSKESLIQIIEKDLAKLGAYFLSKNFGNEFLD